MNRASRDRFAASTDQADLAYGESACLETPPDFFAALDRGFHFDVDLTANAGNHLCPVWFGPGSSLGPRGIDALAVDWRYDGHLKCGFSNPPYGHFIPQVLKKAVQEATRGFTSVFLLPMRASSWYTDIVLVHATYLWHLEPRLTFWYNGVPKPTSKVKWSQKKYGADPQYLKGQDGNVYYVADTQPLLAPANALFDSIVVVFRPQMPGLPHLPYTVAPRVWRWKDQSVLDLL